MAVDAPPQWERKPNEPSELYNRFHRYLVLPGKRSLLAAYNSERVDKGRKRTTTFPDSWRNAFNQWCWEERAAAFDTYQHGLELEKWRLRRDELRELEWELAAVGIKKFQEMFKMPIVRKITEDGRTIIEPGGWNFRFCVCHSYRVFRPCSKGSADGFRADAQATA